MKKTDMDDFGQDRITVKCGLDQILKHFQGEGK